MICDKTPEDHVVMKTVKEIISGERKGQDIPEDLRVVSKQAISLTCLGRKKDFYLNKIKLINRCDNRIFQDLLNIF